jgi:hypothetical protein
VLYLSPPTGSKEVHDAMTAREIGCMTTPAQGNRIPDDALWAADNGKFGKGWPGSKRWSAWLAGKVARYGTERCLWAAAPDVPFDSAGTLRESLPWLGYIRGLGIPAAFCAQDGSEHGLIPWDDLDVLFLAGSTRWKLSYTATVVADEAHGRGKSVHLARVNSRVRLAHGEAIDADTADGTYVAFGPLKNLERLRRFQAAARRNRHAGIQFDLFEGLEEIA